MPGQQNVDMAKQPHIFGWDEEPVDERPSEFMASTGYSVLSGYHPIDEPLRPLCAQRSSGRFGFKTLLVSCLAILALGACALAELAPLLRS